MNRPNISKDGKAVTVEFDNDRQARDYAALVGNDDIRANGTKGEKAENAVKGFFDGTERVLTRVAEGATGTVGIALLGLALGFLGWHSWHGWWQPLGLAPLSVIGPVLVLTIIGLSLLLAQSRLEELQAVKAGDVEREADEQTEQKAYKALRWACVAANAVAAISFQTSMITDSDTGRMQLMAEIRDLRVERSELVRAKGSIEDEALSRGRMSPSAQSSDRLERDIDRMFRAQARNQLNEPVKGKTVADLVGDCTTPLPNWQTYYEVYCPAILDRQDELDAVRDWEEKDARVKAIDLKTDQLSAELPPSVGVATQAKSLFGAKAGIVTALVIAFVFGAFEFLLGKMSYHWRLTKLKAAHLK